MCKCFIVRDVRERERERERESCGALPYIYATYKKMKNFDKFTFALVNIMQNAENKINNSLKKRSIKSLLSMILTINICFVLPHNYIKQLLIVKQKSIIILKTFKCLINK